MRRFAILTGSILLGVAMLRMVVDGQETKGKPVPPAPATKVGVPPAAKPAGPAPEKPSPTPAKQPASVANPATKPQPKVEAAPMSADEIAIRETGKTYVAAFNHGNAKLVAEHYTAEAEYIDESGRTIQGRPAIEESLKSFFTNNPGAKIDLNIVSIRLIGPSVAIEDGTTTIKAGKDAETVINLYTVVHTKNASKWQVASVREAALKPQRQHRAQLQQLDWMLGEWIHEGNDAVVEFRCEPVDNGTFLVRHFKIQIAGQEAISGSQRIGWDAQAGKFKAWIFDSDGGHSEGYWHRDGETWVLKSHGVTADGESASSTSIYAIENPHTMTFQSMDHEVAGLEMPDSAKVKIVRKPPRPE